MENLFGLFLFILFLIFRAFGETKGRRGQRRVPKPQETEEPPWWEEYFEEEKLEKPRPVVVKPTQLEVKKVKGPLIQQGSVEGKPAENRKASEKKKEIRQGKREAEAKARPAEQGVHFPRLNPEAIRQAFIWAEILQPPKAKRKHNRGVV